MLNWIKTKFKKQSKPIKRPIVAGSNKASDQDSSQGLYGSYHPLSPAYIGLSSGESDRSCSSSDSYSSSSSSDSSSSSSCDSSFSGGSD